MAESKRKTATIKDIARETNLSPSTVSNYLNGHKVRESTRLLIEAAIDKLQYRINETAREVRSGKSRIVGIIVPNLQMDYARSFALHARYQLERMGFITLVYDCNSSDAEEMKYVERMMRRRACAIISLPFNPHTEVYQMVMENGTPLITIGDPIETFNTDRAAIDDTPAFKEMISDLYNAGHTRVGIIMGQLDHSVMGRRLQVFKDCFEENFDSLDDNLILSLPCQTVDSGYTAAYQMMDSPNPPTAIVCMNSELLTGAHIALMERGLRIPDDISLCGVGINDGRDNASSRRLSIIQQPIARLAEGVAQRVRQIYIAGKDDSDLKVSIEIKATYRRAQSIAPPPHKKSK